MNKGALKNLLLKTDCFIENEYFILYLDLINNNLSNKYLKGITNKHHVIPLTYFVHIKDKPNKA